MAPKLKFYRFDANEYIYQINQQANEMYFLVKGEVALQLINEEGRVINYRIRTPGQHFGEIDMLMNREQLTTDYARALTNCECLAILYEDLQWVLRKFEEHMEKFLEDTSVRQIRYNEAKTILMRTNSGIWESPKETPTVVRRKTSFYEQEILQDDSPADI